VPGFSVRIGMLLLTFGNVWILLFSKVRINEAAESGFPLLRRPDENWLRPFCGTSLALASENKALHIDRDEGPMAQSRFIHWFRELSIADGPLVGGKNASLGELYGELSPKGIRVPSGFAVTAVGYRCVLR
jgi:hypothetical protein